MCKLINKYSKTGNLKYISHLDVLRFIQRAVKRADLPAKYSEGFNPHMKTAFGYPLSLGTESIGEYFEIEMNEKTDPELFMKKMNSVLPNEMQLLMSRESSSTESLMSRCAYAEYLITLETNLIDIHELNKLFDEMLSDGMVYPRQKKNKKNQTVIKEINTKDYIKYLKAQKHSEDKVTVEAVFLTTETGSMKVDELLKLMEGKGFTFDYHTIMKIDALDKDMKPIL